MQAKTRATQGTVLAHSLALPRQRCRLSVVAKAGKEQKAESITGIVFKPMEEASCYSHGIGHATNALAGGTLSLSSLKICGLPSSFFPQVQIQLKQQSQKDPTESLVRMHFSSKAEAAMNEQINVEVRCSLLRLTVLKPVIF